MFVTIELRIPLLWEKLCMENMETIAWEALVEAEGQIARISLLTLYTVIARPLRPRCRVDGGIGFGMER